MTPYDEFKILLKKGNFREAAFLAKRAAEAGGRDAVFWRNQQALALLKSNKPKEAFMIAHEILGIEPGNCFAMITAADALFLQNKNEDAYAYYRSASGYAATIEEAKKGVIDCLLKLKLFTDALDEIAGLRTMDSAYIPQKIRALTGLGHLDDAVACCTAWLDEAPDNCTAQRMMFDLDVALLGENAALVKYETLAKTAPNRSICREVKDEVLNRKRSNATTKGKEPATLFLMSKKAFTLAKTGQEREAVQLMEAVLRKDPGNEYVHNGYVAAARRIGYLVPALKFYQELSRLYPEAKVLHHYVRKVSKECRQLAE